MNSTSARANHTAGLGGEATPAPAASPFSPPASPSGGEFSLPSELEAAAVNSAEIAIVFIKRGERGKARAHLQRAIEQLNEAEIED